MESSPTPVAEGPEALAVEQAVELLSGRRIAAVTGAGMSTDSGIPDYRGAGAPVRSPMTYSQFVADPDYRPLRDAVAWAAAVVEEIEDDRVKAAVGNS